MTHNELEPLVIHWATEKGILKNGNPLAQAQKTKEEVNELLEACVAQNIGFEKFENSKGKVVNTDEEIIEGLGKILVTIIIQAKMQGVKLEACLESAYNIISKRTEHNDFRLPKINRHRKNYQI